MPRGAGHLLVLAHMRKSFASNQDGATAIEYGLIAALIVIACVVAFTSLGGGSNGLWGKINDNVGSKL